MTHYHVAFWALAAMSSVLLAVAVIAIAVVGHDQRGSVETGVSSIVLLALGVTFTISMSCLGLRRDFMRPLVVVVAMAVLFMSVLGLFALRVASTPRR